MKVKSTPTEQVHVDDFRKNVSDTVEVEKFPTPEEQITDTEKEEYSISQYQKYVLNKSPACMKRIQRMKVSDKEITDLLETHEGRRKIGYNYLTRTVNWDA